MKKCLTMSAVIGLIAMLAAPACLAETGIDIPTQPLTWEYLATVGGCSLIVLIIVQLTKKLLDKLVKIPTAIYAYILAIVVLLLATAFTIGLTPSNAFLTLLNGWIVSSTASRTFDAIASR